MGQKYCINLCLLLYLLASFPIVWKVDFIELFSLLTTILCVQFFTVWKKLFQKKKENSKYTSEHLVKMETLFHFLPFFRLSKENLFRWNQNDHFHLNLIVQYFVIHLVSYNSRSKKESQPSVTHTSQRYINAE